MSLFDSIFGAGMSQALGQINHTSTPQYSNAWYANQQGLANAYNAQQARAFTPPKWVLNGVPYYSVTEFADAVFGDTPARTMFLLKYSDKDTK